MLGLGGSAQALPSPASHATLAAASSKASAGPKAGSASGIEKSSFDNSVSPAQDFYLYANGGWMKSHPIPSDKPRWGRFNILAENNQDILRTILETTARSGGAPGSNDQKLGDFYSLGMDETLLTKQGVEPLQDDLAKIRAATDRKAIEAEVISLQRRGVNPFFTFGASQDPKDSNMVIGELRQGGLGLPERDYYTRTDEKSVKQRAAYQEHMEKGFKLLGNTDAQAKEKAAQVFALETKLAQASLTNVELRDPQTTYHPTPASGLNTATGTWSWAEYLSSMGYPGGAEGRINVATPKFFEAFYTLFDKTELPVIHSYLEWTLLRTSDSYLSEDLANYHFEFYGKVLTGTPAQTPRWRRVVGTIDKCMGEALGKKYVEKNFPPAAKARVKEMVGLLREALNEDLGTLTWMTPETQKAARAKLAAFNTKIGYPDRWRDYSSLQIKKDSYLANVWRSQAFAVARDLKQIGKPPDRNEWYMSPPTVNAYYDPQMNEIVFPAGIMQPPFFSLAEDDALNFGGLGAVIGHEITHGFDDQGRQYDGKGNLSEWWTPKDLANYKERAQGVEDQFSAYTVQDGLHVNGKLVLGESIADLGGLRLSYLAYQKYQKRHPAKTLDGFTPEQRFFLGYARIWAINLRPEYERLQINTDPHPPAHFRVNGPLSNMPEFAKAFKVPAGSPMARKKSVLLW